MDLKKKGCERSVLAKKEHKILTFKRIAAFLMSMCLLLGSSDFGLTLEAAENVSATFSEKTSEDGTSSEITMSVSAADENTEILEIKNPDGSVSGDTTATTYSVAENGTYEFAVSYRVGDGAEAEETFSYIVSSIGGNEEETGPADESSEMENTGGNESSDETEEAGDGKNTGNTDETETGNTGGVTAAANGPAKAPRAVGDVEVNEENFPDAKFREYILTQLPCGQDGVISANELSSVTVIDCSGMGIGSLEGIKTFTYLNTLRCNRNNLTELDLSNMRMLKTLQCMENNISSLNLTGVQIDSGFIYDNCLTRVECSAQAFSTSKQFSGGSQTVEVVMVPSDSGGWKSQNSVFNYMQNPTLSTGSVNTSGFITLSAGQKPSTCTFDAGASRYDLDCRLNGTISFVYQEETGLPINEENFPDSAFRQYISENFDKDDNGYLSDGEIAEAKTININRSGVSSLQGIEYFTELEELWCDGNTLKTLDLSKNTKLENLACASNEIEELNLGDNTVLRQVACNSNNLKELDISKNTGLVVVECRNNHLAYLVYGDADREVAVTGFEQTLELQVEYDDTSGVWKTEADTFIGDTTFGTAGVSFDPDGKCANIEGYVADTTFTWTPEGVTTENSLTGTVTFVYPDGLPIDEEHFPDPVFRDYLMEQDYGQDGLIMDDEIADIISISITENSELKSLQGIEYFTELSSLSCYGCQLESLDVSKNTKLMLLQCQENNLKELNLGNLSSLMIVNCSDNAFTYIEGEGYTVSNTQGSYAGNQNLEMPVTYDSSIGSWRTADNTFGDGTIINSLTESLADGTTIEFIEEGNYATLPDTSFTSAYFSWDKDGDLPVSGIVEFVFPEGVPITKQFFPDDNFRDYLLSQDYGEDEFLADTEIAEITELDVSIENLNLTLGTEGKTIYDLTGIEYFTALTSLECGGNALTTLDVSANTLLESLSCGNNDLSRLDVSENEKLTYLDCYMNGMTELKLGPEEFEHINCSVNKLTYVSGDAANFTETGTYIGTDQTPEIMVVYNSTDKIWKIADNSFAETVTFSEGDVTFVAEGNYITIPGTVASTEFEWTMPEASLSGTADSLLSGTVTFVQTEGILINKENFPDDNFRAYLLEQDYGKDAVLTDAEIRTITEMDCSSRGIADLTGIVHFTSLKDLDCSHNGLTEMYLYEQYVEVDCSHNQISTLHVYGAYDGSNLQRLDCSYNRLLKIQDGKDGVLSSSNNFKIGEIIGNGQSVTLDMTYDASESTWKSGAYLIGPNTTLTGSGSGSVTADEELYCIRTSGTDLTNGTFTVYPCGPDSSENTLTGEINFVYHYSRNGYIDAKEAKEVTSADDLKQFGLVGGLSDQEMDTLSITVDDLAGLMAGTQKAYEVTYSWTEDGGKTAQETREITVVPEGSAITGSRNTYMFLPPVLENRYEVGDEFAMNVFWLVYNQRQAMADGKGQIGSGTYESAYEMMINLKADILGNNRWNIIGEKIYPAYGEYPMTYIIPLGGEEELRIDQVIRIMPDEPTELVIIPSSIELEQVKGSPTIEASTTSEVSLETDAQGDYMPDVNITADAEFQITNEDQESLECVVYVDGSKYDGSGPLAVLNKKKDTVSQQFEIRALKGEEAYVGQFSGTMNFTVSYEE